MTARVPMRALIGQMHDGVRLRIGDTFRAAATEVEEMEALGIAVRVVDGEPVPPHIEEEAEQRRDRYKRRDLRPKR